MTYKGKGIGLALIKNIIKIMGGDLRVRSEVDIGSEFICELQFQKPHHDYKLKPKEVEVITVKPKKKTSILLAEDNYVNQRLVTELLSKRDIEVDTVENGIQIFDKLEKKKYDMILMDVQMPEMDGLEATRIIRGIERDTGGHIPIVGITAYSMKADRERCLESGMDDYLTKPFNKDEFFKKIEVYTQKN